MARVRKFSNWMLLLAAGMVLAAGGRANAAESGSTNEGRASEQRALFAGGCFWCVAPPFTRLDGVLSVQSGYAGGTTENPTYENYHGGGHIEVVEVVYDPARVGYDRLLDTFWRQIDPTDEGGQFADRGRGYTTAIFYHTEEQRLWPSSPRRAWPRATSSRTAGHAHSAGAEVLPGRGVPPGVRPQEPFPLQDVPVRLGPRRIPAADLGKRGLAFCRES